MLIGEIAKSRKCGQVRFYAVHRIPGDLNRVLEICHLKQEEGRLLEVTREDAVGVLACWLHRDAAYGTELMSAHSARDLGERFMKEFADETSRFFTNGRWHESRRTRDWLPLTDSAFDGGILIESGKAHGATRLHLVRG